MADTRSVAVKKNNKAEIINIKTEIIRNEAIFMVKGIWFVVFSMAENTVFSNRIYQYSKAEMRFSRREKQLNLMRVVRRRLFGRDG